MSKQYTFQSISLLGILSLLFSIAILPPLAISLFIHDGEMDELLKSFLIIITIGFLLWFPFRTDHMMLRKKDGFLIVVFFWVILSIFGSIPFIIAFDISLADSLFESVSGLTTTGATVLQGLDTMPPSILFYRAELQWIGGMGLVVLAVAIIPRLGIGGMSIYLAEAPGPMKDEKLTSRLMDSSRIIWRIYVLITLSCTLAYWLAGMTFFDAISHSMATVSTGGFSTHDQSLGYFQNPIIEYIAVVFMLLGAINFSVHYLAIHKLSIMTYIHDVEVRAFFSTVIVVIIICASSLSVYGYYDTAEQSIRNSTFEVVSVITSTGFGTVDFSLWPTFLPLMLILISFVGGCGGSTAGGMKVLRMLVLTKLSYREIKRLLHPDGIFPVRLGGKGIIQEKHLKGIFGYFSLYIFTFVVLLLLMVLANVDQVTAFSAIATCMNNMGPGLGEVTMSFASLSDTAKYISIAAMLLGRLEIISILVLFHPKFWTT